MDRWTNRGEWTSLRCGVQARRHRVGLHEGRVGGGGGMEKGMEQGREQGTGGGLGMGMVEVVVKGIAQKEVRVKVAAVMVVMRCV